MRKLSIPEIRSRIEELKQLSPSTPREKKAVDCPICDDLEYVRTDGVATPCVCQRKKQMLRRMKQAMLPDTFEQARIESYVPQESAHRAMLELATRYLATFDSHSHSLGFLAKLAESTLLAEKDPEKRRKWLDQYNSYGLGKTHLTVAVGKKLIEQGHEVLMISDPVFMEELSIDRVHNPIKFQKSLHEVIHAEVLIWDDLGKSPVTPFTQRMYYQILNARYEAKRRILFSTNENGLTLQEKISPACASRLIAMCGEFKIEVYGPDWRPR